MKSNKKYGLAFLLFATAGLMSACSSTPDQPQVDPNASAKIDKIEQARKVFDASGGDLTKVSAEDKAKLLALFGAKTDLQGLWTALARNPMAPMGNAAPKK